MLDKINLADLRSFVFIAQLGNFTRAAEALKVSRSHVSRQISQLESDLGVTLLLRTTRTLKLTKAGQQLFEQCQTAFNDIDQALLAAIDAVDEIRGHIAINCVGGVIGEDVLVPMINEFMAEYPEVSISLDFSSHRVDLIQDDFDVAFRMGSLPDASFVARKLADIEMVTVASPSYLNKSALITHPKHLEQHRCLTGSVNRWSFINNKTADSADVQIKGDLQCKNGRALVNGALLGNGVIRVPLLYCQRDVEEGRLQKVFYDWQIPSVDFSLIYHKDRFRPARLTRLIEFFISKFEHK
ncbi:LysR family transcriptional regulator [Vibrio sp. UCD-FRSSP16_10]|uniref:LysR substrate-binding domain-containing protein n=1 Tax=unclassified Vibrio TaxID=2614977 RepID=UPI00080004A6|nr:MULTISPECIES: LysR substrate-binding domain-containing protein [unclassified Vibrio]OBT13290.1 LysR family transcriptional regulator [Vibrio sp. UCD-FRSSP16_30]OBT19640.1 LysR family transcriptional regulator [Vibrio sp. UCD-FRSSP16_10]